VKRAFALFVSVTFLSSFFCGCATIPGSVAAHILESKEKTVAVEFPDLILTDLTGTEHEVKILSIQGRIVTVMPFPYWFLDPIEISLNQIKSLKIKKRSYPGLTVTLVLAEAGFIIGGGTMGILADSRGDYGLAIGLGIVGALAGVGSTLFSDVWDLGDQMYPEYNFSEMNEADKLHTVLTLMGVLGGAS
jgi:hypothetical protein